MLAVVVYDQPGYFAVADLQQVRLLRLHLPKLQSARLPATAEVGEHQDALLVDLAELVRLGAKALPRAQEAAETLRQPVQPRPAGRIQPVGNHELDLGVRPLDRAEVAAFPVRADRAHQLHVRRGHRPSVADAAVWRPCRSWGWST